MTGSASSPRATAERKAIIAAFRYDVNAGHHNGCDSHHGAPCDCYFSETERALAALDAWEAAFLAHDDALRQRDEERDKLQHIIDCADTPLMRDVLAERDRLVDALRQARDLAIAVADKNIGELSERARVVQGIANDALGDVPSADDVAGILRRPYAAEWPFAVPARVPVDQPAPPPPGELASEGYHALDAETRWIPGAAIAAEVEAGEQPDPQTADDRLARLVAEWNALLDKDGNREKGALHMADVVSEFSVFGPDNEITVDELAALIAERDALAGAAITAEAPPPDEQWADEAAAELTRLCDLIGEVDIEIVEALLARRPGAAVAPQEEEGKDA